MTARVLSPEEWYRLEGTDLEDVVEFLKPESAKVVVVERDGHILGQWLATPVWHVEGLWIDPAYRGRSSVARRLWRGMQAVMSEAGATTALTGAATDQVRDLLAHAGAKKLPFDTYVLPFKRES